MAVGRAAKYRRVNDTGFALVYEANQGEWGPAVVDGGDVVGASVALSSDGLTLAVGDDKGFGVVEVFTRQGTGHSWVLLGQTQRGARDGEYFGISLALDARGDTLAVGAKNYNCAKNISEVDAKCGQVQVFKLTSNSTAQSDGASATKLGLFAGAVAVAVASF